MPSIPAHPGRVSCAEIFHYMLGKIANIQQRPRTGTSTETADNMHLNFYRIKRKLMIQIIHQIYKTYPSVPQLLRLQTIYRAAANLRRRILYRTGNFHPIQTSSASDPALLFYRPHPYVDFTQIKFFSVRQFKECLVRTQRYAIRINRQKTQPIKLRYTVFPHGPVGDVDRYRV